MKTPTTRHIGNQGEYIAEKYLQEKWYTILAKNFVVYGGEIDIIAKKDDIIAFVEVRFRKTDAFSHPIETISPSKIRSILRAMYAYIERENLDEDNCRLDVIGIIPKAKIDGGGHALTHIKWVEIPEIE